MAYSSAPDMPGGVAFLFPTYTTTQYTAIEEVGLERNAFTQLGSHSQNLTITITTRLKEFRVDQTTMVEATDQMEFDHGQGFGGIQGMQDAQGAQPPQDTLGIPVAQRGRGAQSTQAIEIIELSSDTEDEPEPVKEKTDVEKKKEVEKEKRAERARKKEEMKEEKKQVEMQATRDMDAYLNRMDGTPHGPALREIRELYVAKMKRNDDFLRRAKNKFLKLAVEGFERCETATQAWYERFIELYRNTLDEHMWENCTAEHKVALVDATQGLVCRRLLALQELLTKERKRAARFLNANEEDAYQTYLSEKAEDEKELLKVFGKHFGA